MVEDDFNVKADEFSKLLASKIEEYFRALNDRAGALISDSRDQATGCYTGHAIGLEQGVESLFQVIALYASSKLISIKAHHLLEKMAPPLNQDMRQLMPMVEELIKSYIPRLQKGVSYEMMHVDVSNPN